jgi:tryptophan halogenase
MSKPINKIVIVGGGSAGWMTAATLIQRLPGREVVLIEDPNTPTVGVGESTLGFINEWLRLLQIKHVMPLIRCLLVSLTFIR